LLPHEREYRDPFAPHLQARTARRWASPIFVTALLTAERLRIVYLPENINSLEEHERDPVVRDAIQKHYRVILAKYRHSVAFRVITSSSLLASAASILGHHMVAAGHRSEL
jgi:hypothetical protein